LASYGFPDNPSVLPTYSLKANILLAAAAVGLLQNQPSFLYFHAYLWKMTKIFHCKQESKKNQPVNLCTVR